MAKRKPTDQQAAIKKIDKALAGRVTRKQVEKLLDDPQVKAALAARDKRLGR